MTHSEIDLRGEFIFKTKMRDADSRRETHIFLFHQRNQRLSASKLESGLIIFVIPRAPKLTP